MSATPTQRTIGVNTAADILGISPKTVRKWLGNGKIAKIKLGTRVLIEMSEIDRLVDSGRVVTATND